jgi:16S rRNA (guanine527-N7)-methyltransferase
MMFHVEHCYEAFRDVSRETSLKAKERELLRSAIEQSGLSLSHNQMECFATYYKLLLLWNRAVGLISRGDEERVVPRHFVESLLIVPLLISSRRETVLDIGSGAGFPGLPLKILLPHLQVDFLEPKRKRASFLKKVVGVLSLSSARVICARIEDVEEHPIRKSYDAIVTRAVAHPLELLHYTLPLLARDGDFIAYVPGDLRINPGDLPEGIVEGSMHQVGLPGFCNERSIFVARRG